jgi:hypothetical protein
MAALQDSFLELDFTPTLSLSAKSIVAMEQSMTLELVDGMILALLPSMLTVAWFAWRAA